MPANIDFETRSAIDLKTAGVHVYAAHPTTRVLCLGYKIDGGPTKVWAPGRPAPVELFDRIAQGDEIHAWNAGFERVIWPLMVARHGAPAVDLGQWRCTMVRALLMGFPPALDAAGPVMGLPFHKDKKGHALMLQLCKPRQRWQPDSKGYSLALSQVDGVEYELLGAEVLRWWVDPEKDARLESYCARDVDTEHAAAQVLDPIPPQELEGWRMDQRINDYGFEVDKELATRALQMVKPATQATNQQLAKVTDGELKSVSKPNDIRAWLNTRLGLELDSISSDVLNDLLVTAVDEGSVEAEVIRLRQAGAKTSTAKLKSLQLGTGPGDNRFRGGLQYAGAPRTNRWGGRRFQPQNLPRPPKWALEAVEFILNHNVGVLTLIYGSPLEAISAVIRSCIVARPGYELHFADYNAIEARFVAWICGAVELLEGFRHNEDTYRKMASKIFGIPVIEIGEDSFERFLGKQTILGCGYGMGAPKFASQCRKFGQYVPNSLAQQAVTTFRESNKAITEGWYELERASIAAFDTPNTWVQALGGKIHFWYDGVTYLRLRLPSGRLLSYLHPQVVDDLTPWGTPTRKMTVRQWSTMTNSMQRQNMYGGRWLENISQAGCRDIMVEAMLRLHHQGWNLILSVHDETGAEEEIGARRLEDMTRIMEEPVQWAPDLPLLVKGWTGRRYRK